MKGNVYAVIPLLTTVSGFAIQFPLGCQPFSLINAISQTLRPGGRVLGRLASYWNGGSMAATSVIPQTFAQLDEENDPHPSLNQDGDTSELLTHPQFPEYKIRVKETRLCEDQVNQYSGYLESTDGKHLFFWFVEHRDNPRPETAPLVLWLNGGPGCSSLTGALFGLGPCNIKSSVEPLSWNEHGWNQHANMIFLDQPVDVGFSYSEGQSAIDNTPAAAEDVYAFLQLFFKRFDKYTESPFSIAAESYGGHYVPRLASEILKHNEERPLRAIPIKLKTIMIGNGLTSPYEQYGSLPLVVCDGRYKLYDIDHPECLKRLEGLVVLCQKQIEMCYQGNFSCATAQDSCEQDLVQPVRRHILERNKNPFNLAEGCDNHRVEDQDGESCYQELGNIERFLNDSKNQEKLNLERYIKFQICNQNVQQGFSGSGDGVTNSSALIPNLLANGIRVLIYGGEDDFLCNPIGNLQWMKALANSEFGASELVDWYVEDTSRPAGKVRKAGEGAGSFTYVVVGGAGHMVPHDQPAVAQYLFGKWLRNEPLTVSNPAHPDI